jgi:hypothetical protein
MSALNQPVWLVSFVWNASGSSLLVRSERKNLPHACAMFAARVICAQQATT